MEERDSREIEMLASIHNQLVDLKNIIVEIELSNPATSHSLQTRLRQIAGGGEQHIDVGGRTGSAEPRQQKVIAPNDPDIQPGSGA